MVFGGRIGSEKLMAPFVDKKLCLRFNDWCVTLPLMFGCQFIINIYNILTEVYSIKTFTSFDRFFLVMTFINFVNFLYIYMKLVEVFSKFL